ncbi:phycocyanin alpha phycocyanobilin lyase [Oceanicola granulosus HTCC2516]|uniref:Phycocyanin alpha phycocyanobilin lyase n=1 Tax=Oceanicola granulosus (strain ATCC BAA-861 / DSM 15982 / KCTC 12143 / HTCC2516) TaxID=314256 RepID=Q2CJ84_OCEGH|nr:MFS transporter [Oceanicola granulosus]EAR52716.1 phycocyanin alpha phycocyanobilin lyase [Oceanicola granulosus HTCC2516]
MSGAEGPARAQSDYDKLRRLPFFYLSTLLTGTAVICTIGAPMAMFAAELGLAEDRIGLLAGMMPAFQALGVLTLPMITRFGSRRMAGTALAARYLFLTLFFAAPLFAARPDTAFAILAVAMLGFAICRSLAEAALVPWSQEFMPRAVRGRIAGRMALVYLPVALIVSWATRMWLDASEGLTRFYPIFGVGIAVGIAGALMLFGLRGGAPAPVAARTRGYRDFGEPLRDRNYVVFLVASALQNLVMTAIALFLLLYFRQRVGLSSGTLVFMAAFIPVGAAAGTLAAGWFVDRYGTRAIRVALQAGQVALLVALALAGGRFGPMVPLVAAVFFAVGFLFQSSIAVANVYMLNVVPPSSKESYTVLHYAVDGVVAGVVTFAAGFLLTWIGPRRIEALGLTFGNFEALFLLAALVTLVSAWCFATLREDGATTVRDFVGHFATGSPLRALWGINRYERRTSEQRRRELAFGFGFSGSLLAKEELIEAVRDPSFDVRHEAVRALGRLGAHPDVVRALRGLLEGDSPAELRYAAIEALGRLPAPDCAPLIAAALEDASPLMRARALRSLGDLRHVESLPRMRAMLASDPAPDCRLAAASALGKLGDGDSVAALMDLCLGAPGGPPLDEGRAKVVLLAVAKILRCEKAFAQILRLEERGRGVALAGQFLRLSHAVRALPGGEAQAKRLARFAADEDVADPAAARACLLDLRPLLARSADAALLAVLDRAAHAPAPQPALVVLLLVAVQRHLRP